LILNLLEGLILDLQIDLLIFVHHLVVNENYAKRLTQDHIA